MKRIILTLCTAAILLFACNNEKKADQAAIKSTTAATVPPTTSKEKEEAWVPVDSATMMKNMMEYSTPGPMHQMLASWKGTWKSETTMWEYDGAAPRKSTSTAVNTIIMGGKYLSGKHSGEAFEGMSIIGYDNAKKQFTSSWIDTWSTGTMNMSGPWNESSKTITFTGKKPDINRPGKECSFKEVVKVLNDNTQQMEMYGPDPKTGKEYKMMEIKMSRKK